MGLNIKILSIILLIVIILYVLNEKYKINERLIEYLEPHRKTVKKDKPDNKRHYFRSIMSTIFILGITFEDTPEKNAWDNLVSNLYWSIPVSILVFMYLIKPSKKKTTET